MVLLPCFVLDLSLHCRDGSSSCLNVSCLNCFRMPCAGEPFNGRKYWCKRGLDLLLRFVCRSVSMMCDS
jgi:hypothetical protein